MINRCNHSFTFSRIFSAICLTTAFQLGTCAQSSQEAKPQVQAEAKKSANKSAPLQTAQKAAKTEAPKAGEQTAKSVDTPAREPKRTSAQPATKAQEQKLNETSFASGENDSPHAPRKFKASAYSIHGRTRSGTVTQPGTMAADTRVLPLGTVVQVNAGKYSGVYTVHDTGGAIKGNRVDVWFPSGKEARRFGRRDIKLVVLKYPGQNAPAAKSGK